MISAGRMFFKIINDGEVGYFYQFEESCLGNRYLISKVTYDDKGEQLDIMKLVQVDDESGPICKALIESAEKVNEITGTEPQIEVFKDKFTEEELEEAAMVERFIYKVEDGSYVEYAIGKVEAPCDADLYYAYEITYNDEQEVIALENFAASANLQEMTLTVLERIVDHYQENRVLDYNKSFKVSKPF